MQIYLRRFAIIGLSSQRRKRQIKATDISESEPAATRDDDDDDDDVVDAQGFD